MFKSKLISDSKDIVARGGRPGRGDARGGTSMDRQVQHGTLRSELDEPARLPDEFVRVADAVSALRSEYEQGVLTRSQAAERLSQLKLVTSDGAEWTLGMTTGQWHRRYQGGEWGQAMPPEAAEEEFSPAAPGQGDMLDAYFASIPTETLDPASADAADSAATVDELGTSTEAADEPAVMGQYAWEGVSSDVTIDVTGGQIPSDVDAPHPEVSAEASHASLPTFEAVEAPKDMQGLWGTSWVSVEREQSDELEALFDAPSAQGEPEAPFSTPAASKMGDWSSDEWPDNTSLDDLFSTDDVAPVVPAQVAASWAAAPVAPNDVAAAPTDQDQITVWGTEAVPTATTSGTSDDDTSDDVVLALLTAPQEDSYALIARAREDLITDDPLLADLLAEARGDASYRVAADPSDKHDDDDLGLPAELFGD